jgi:hypothetical protein
MVQSDCPRIALGMRDIAMMANIIIAMEEKEIITMLWMNEWDVASLSSLLLCFEF